MNEFQEIGLAGSLSLQRVIAVGRYDSAPIRRAVRQARKEADGQHALHVQVGAERAGDQHLLHLLRGSAGGLQQGLDPGEDGLCHKPEQRVLRIMVISPCKTLVSLEVVGLEHGRLVLQSPVVIADPEIGH